MNQATTPCPECRGDFEALRAERDALAAHVERLLYAADQCISHQGCNGTLEQWKSAKQQVPTYE